jgi:hypothetical protein
MAEVVETIHVNGFRCERCATRLAAVLEGHAGLLAAHGNLMGEVTLTYDDDLTSRVALLAAMARGGFHEASPVAAAAE